MNDQARPPESSPHFRLHRGARSWGGVTLVTETWRLAAEPVHHEFPAAPHIRLVTALESEGGIPQPRLSPHRALPVKQGHGAVNLVSAGMPMWGVSETVTFVRDASLLFDEAHVEAHLGDAYDRARLDLPLLCHNDSRLFTVLRLLADAVEQNDPHSEAYGESLIGAALSLLFARQPARTAFRGGLTRRQLDLAIEAMTSRLPQRMAITELAALLDLSAAHFSRAFKRSTGVAPYQWQLRERLEGAMRQLRNGVVDLDAVADEAGFIDQSHFSRAFRNHVGVTPGQWRRHYGRSRQP
jgi:AraC family transcriptional regulator